MDYSNVKGNKSYQKTANVYTMTRQPHPSHTVLKVS